MKQVLLAGKTFNVHPTDAQSQLEAYTMVAANLSYAISKSGSRDVQVTFLAGFLTSLNKPTLDKLAEILLKNVRIHGDNNTLVTVDLFHNQVTSYYLLIAEAVLLNLSDFFTFILSEKSDGTIETPNQAI